MKTSIVLFSADVLNKNNHATNEREVFIALKDSVSLVNLVLAGYRGLDRYINIFIL